jgi:hypothetical protein
VPGLAGGTVGGAFLAGAGWGRVSGGVAGGPAETRDYSIDAGRVDGAWSLRVSPWNGRLEEDVLTGPPVVDLREQTEGPDPLALLRALLTGGGA